ncbi:hypothetical protein [Pandoraea oxalativorans]|uniref:Uncharacterized protein n=1 Tax=Pandoraea oxalativorans TaxID=573737 RepID=A0A0G3IDR4_9BURK|nr:hypothetical protein [Pandoraea oxalativorans]AKK24763.1 hypothetical protein MB84_28595 [Pandoraea oxalativorans]
MLEQVTHTTPLRQGNIAATRSPKTVLLRDVNGAAALTLGDLVAARNATSLAAVNPKPNWFSGCFTREASETTKRMRELVYCAYHPDDPGRLDVPGLIEIVRAQLHPDDQAKLRYIGDDYRGLHIEFTGVDEAPLTLYAKPQGAAKLATKGIRRARDQLATLDELEQRYRKGGMTKDPVFQSAPVTQKALLGQLAAASTYDALVNALSQQESTVLLPKTPAPTQLEEHKEAESNRASVGGMQSTQPMPEVTPRVA